MAAGFERHPDVIARGLCGGNVQRRRLDQHAQRCAALRKGGDDVATARDARGRAGHRQVPQRPARLDVPRGGQRVDSLGAVDGAMHSRRDAGHAAGEVEIARQSIASLVEQPREAPADVTEPDEGEINEHRRRLRL